MKKITPEYVVEGERFRTARKMLGYTQSELAEKSGVSFGSIKAYERGLNLPGMTHAQKLETAGINMLYIATGTGPPIITPDMYPEPDIYVKQPVPGNPAVSHVTKVPATYDLIKNNAQKLDDKAIDMLGRARIEADRLVERLLQEIHFSDAKGSIIDMVVHLLQHKKITEDVARAMLGAYKETDEVTKESLEYAQHVGAENSEIEALKAQAELAQKEAEIAKKEAEIAKAQARAEIAEARLEIQQSQIDDFQLVKDMLKRTEDKLESTEEALHQLQKEVVSFQKKAAA